MYGLRGKPEDQNRAMDWPPYNSETIPGKGFLAELAIETFKRAGYDAEINFYPWARAMLVARERVDHCLLGVSITEERKEWFCFLDPLFYDRKAASVFCNKQA